MKKANTSRPSARPAPAMPVDHPETWRWTQKRYLWWTKATIVSRSQRNGEYLASLEVRQASSITDGVAVDPSGDVWS